jgi:hypothetical protein
MLQFDEYGLGVRQAHIRDKCDRTKLLPATPKAVRY